MTLAPGDVHVWCRSTDSLGCAELNDLVSRLSPDERVRYARFRFPRDQRDYAAAHALLRTSLSQYADVAPESWRFHEAPGGKPRLLPADGRPRLSFNLSHTHGLVACAITSGADVGIDVESVDRYVGSGVAERFFSASENADLRRCASEPLRARRFIELWTLKEAYVKAIGKGLSHPLDSIEFDVANRESIRFLAPPDVEVAAWRFSLAAPTEHHCLAVAVRHDHQGVPRIQMMPSTAGDALGGA
jgi:4'-phosphopantetheinyl transferase